GEGEQNLELLRASLQTLTPLRFFVSGKLLELVEALVSSE
uniref:Uncharacterized protein n=1 Tax=Amphimedon queenslandica TaxID=400682 RepID=A0A1X7VSX9_AMPQE